MMRNEDLLVVPVSDYSFKRAEEDKFYARPKLSDRYQNMKYIAFYRSNPISAITHYAKIRNVKTVPKSNFSTKDILIMFGHRGGGEVTLFEIDSFIELDKPIKADGRGFQGIKYSTLDALLHATVITDIK